MEIVTTVNTVLLLVNMLNCLFYSIFFSLFVNLSFGSLRISQINRSFMSCFKGVYEASVVTVDRKGEPIYPYFDKKVFTEYVNTFIDQNVGKFTNDYTLTISFFKDDGVTESALVVYPKSVKVSLDAKVNSLFEYSKSQKFTILEKETL